MFQNPGACFSEVAEAPQAAATQPRGGWVGSAHAIVIPNNYTDTLQVYRHPTSIIQVQTPKIQVRTPKFQVRAPKNKSRHSKYKFRHTKYMPKHKKYIFGGLYEHI